MTSSKLAETSESTSERQSNFELLRIVAMLMIVAHHFSVHSSFHLNDVPLWNSLWLRFLQSGGRIGVNLFVMLSGYFLIQKTELKRSKIVKLWLQLVFFNIGIYIVCIVLRREALAPVSFLKLFLPVLYDKWWFASVYMVMFLLSPFLNTLFRALSREQYMKLLIFCTAIWCVVPTLLGHTYSANNLLGFIYVYSVAAYIRLWKDDIAISSPKSLAFAAIMIGLAVALQIGTKALGEKMGFFKRIGGRIYSQGSPLMLLAAFALFIAFKNMRIGYHKRLNQFAAATFGVYLIHDHPDIRRFLWLQLVQGTRLAGSAYLIPYSIVVVAAVFLSCSVVELIRIRLLERHYMKWVECLCTSVQASWDRVFHSLLEKLG